MLFLMPALDFASEVVLKSGEKLEGKIVEQTDKYIKFDAGVGVVMTYYSDEIDTVDGQKIQAQVSPSLSTTSVARPAEVASQENGPITSQPTNTVQEDIEKAYDFMGKSDCDSALPILNKIIDNDPNNFLAFQGRARCLDFKQDYDNALNDYFKAQEIDPEKGKKLLILIAYVYIEKGNYYQANMKYTQYLQYFPDDGEAHYGMAIADLKQHYIDDSLKELNKAESLGVKDSWGLREKLLTAQSAKEKQVSKEEHAQKDVINNDVQKLYSDLKDFFSWKTLLSFLVFLVFGSLLIKMRSSGSDKGDNQNFQGSIEARCICGATYQFKSEFAGKSVECPKCHSRFKVPEIGPQLSNVFNSSSTPSGDIIFNRDKFFFNRSMLARGYYILDELGQKILFVERPISGRNILVGIMGVFTAVLLFIVCFIAFGFVFSFGGNEDNFVQKTLLGGLAAAIISIFGAILAGSALEKKRQRRIVFWIDETKQKKVLELEDIKYFFFRISYTLVNGDGIILAKFQKNDFYSLFRKRIDCFRPDGSLWFCAKEDSYILSFLRRLLPLEGFGFSFLTNFVFYQGNSEDVIGEFNRTSVLLDKHVLDLSADQSKVLDRRAALVCAVILDLRT